ncbi:MAG: glycosyltransferase family 4 protein [Candidatus Sumerlaeaceae bacterium]|nr:glycosyltransferase family 4 protein [Candidatus Sumerlaeaceae bacterium]
MRILYICGDLGIDVMGRKGASTHMRETCRQLANRGHEVLLVTPVPTTAQNLNFRIQFVDPPRAKWLGIDLRYQFLNARIRAILPKLIREFRPDAVYERYSLYQTAAQNVCQTFGLARILEVNSILSREMHHRLRFPRWASRCESRLWAGERAIICVSTLLEAHIRECTSHLDSRLEHVVISPVGVDPDQFHPGVPPLEWGRYGIRAKKVVGYTGTLTRWHGVDLLFDAALLAKQLSLPVCFVVVGGEEEKVAALRKRSWDLGVGDYLKFLGSFPHDQIPPLLAAMDVCVIPDTQDWSSPTKYFEMAAMQRPVLAAKAPAITEVVGGDGVGALLFERGSAGDLIRKLEMILSDEALALRVGRTARERILRHYSWDCNIARIMKAYAAMGVPLNEADRNLVAKCLGDSAE